MVFKQATALGAVVLVAATCGAAFADQGQKDERRQPWRMTLVLDAPGMDPDAVQYAVFDHDPLADFKVSLDRSRSFHEKQLAGASSDAAKEMTRVTHLSVLWDLLFGEVSGAQVHLLIGPRPGLTQSVASDGPVGQAWLVTKVRQVNGKPVCWRLPIETKPGARLTVTLTEENALDLQAVYREVMDGHEAPPAAVASDAEAAPKLDALQKEARSLKLEMARLTERAATLERQLEALSPSE